jgi:hypothetical protein
MNKAEALFWAIVGIISIAAALVWRLLTRPEQQRTAGAG